MKSRFASIPFTAALVLTLLSPQAALQAEVIQIPIASQGSALKDIPRPRTGMHRNAVHEQFGTPQAINGPVGEPPISRWYYPQFVVTFEHEHVIHTVLKHTPVDPVVAEQAAE